MITSYKWTIFAGLILFRLSGYSQDTKGAPSEHPLSQFDGQKPVFKLKGEQLINKNRHLSFYALTGYRDGVEPITSAYNLNFLAQKDSIQGTHRIKMYNLSITDMLTYGLTKSDEVILEVKDPSKYRYDPKYGNKKEWLRKNAHCYEILLPENILKDMDLVRNHLSYLFNVKCGYQKRLIKTIMHKNGVSQESKIEKEVFVITEIK
ncbi:hypothetical protein QG516_20400 [Pedobacter gandavensis]|uniref:hypothetical protein n=1 Tax=Pedobacter gandavensis TaxID=2679963 RepID=UPI0024787F42|nr:hypothetical protein [Pedobacter gandavensis]WGQ08876.1 hypothetical protein QG516_20400 [Pedobacter gandavensis]